MSIEKKSLISNRMATKKAIVTKPEVNTVAPSKFSVAKSHLAIPKVNVGKTHLALPKVNVSSARLSLNKIKI
jgi:hypothetical protein